MISPDLHYRRMKIARLTFWALTALYWVLVCTLTHLPPKNVPRVGMGDKLQHFLAYGTLAGLIATALWVTFPRRPWLIWTVLVIGLLYGAADELTQPLVGRTCDLEDWYADAIGTMAGILPVALIQRFIRLPGRRDDPAPPARGENLGSEVETALHTYCPESDARAG